VRTRAGLGKRHLLGYGEQSRMTNIRSDLISSWSQDIEYPFERNASCCNSQVSGLQQTSEKPGKEMHRIFSIRISP
jgi:hypothetical protein